jgi:hypothetical protein
MPLFVDYAMTNSVVHKRDHKNQLLFVNVVSTDSFIEINVCVHIVQGKTPCSSAATNE